MTRIGVLSDTHMEHMPPEFQARLKELWQGVSLIMHAGDIVRLPVLDALYALDLGPVHAVAGNMDDHAVRAHLPDQLVVKVEDRRIGLTHGWGAPIGIMGKIRERFDVVDAIVFGHSHRPTNLVKDGVLFFNPGSTGRGIIGSGTVGILSVDQEISGEIIKL